MKQNSETRDQIFQIHFCEHCSCNCCATNKKLYDSYIKLNPIISPTVNIIHPDNLFNAKIESIPNDLLYDANTADALGIEEIYPISDVERSIEKDQGEQMSYAITRSQSAKQDNLLVKDSSESLVNTSKNQSENVELPSESPSENVELPSPSQSENAELPSQSQSENVDLPISSKSSENIELPTSSESSSNVESSEPSTTETTESSLEFDHPVDMESIPDLSATSTSSTKDTIDSIPTPLLEKIIRLLQSHDSEAIEQEEEIQSFLPLFHKIKDDIYLYYKHDWYKFITDEEAYNKLELLHRYLHCSKRCLLYILDTQRLYNPNLQVFAVDTVSNCSKCSLYQPLPTTVDFLNQVQIVSFMDNLHFDYITSLPLVNGFFNSILTITDQATGYTFCVPTNGPIIKAVEFALLNIIQMFGPPVNITGDNAPSFRVPFQDCPLIKQYGIKTHFSSVYYPKANGLVEAKNKLIKMLLKELDTTLMLENWYNNLPLATLLLNVLPNVHNYSSLYLVTGRNVNIPNFSLPDLLAKLNAKEIPLHPAEIDNINYRLYQLSRVLKARKANVDARTHIRNIIIARNKSNVPPLFTTGEIVYKKRTKKHKYEPTWQGPFVISRVLDKHSYKLKHPGASNSLPFTYNQSNLKSALELNGSPIKLLIDLSKVASKKANQFIQSKSQEILDQLESNQSS